MIDLFIKLINTCENKHTVGVKTVHTNRLYLNCLRILPVPKPPIPGWPCGPGNPGGPCSPREPGSPLLPGSPGSPATNQRRDRTCTDPISTHSELVINPLNY